MVAIREEFTRALGIALTDTLETMAFMEVLPRPQRSVHPGDQPLGVKLAILEPVAGELCLWAPRALLCKIAAVIFMLDEDAVDETQLSDIAAELLNTLGGRFLGRLFLPTQLFQLGLPQPLGQTESDGSCSGRSWHFSAEEWPLTLGATGAPLLALVDRTPVTGG